MTRIGGLGPERAKRGWGLVKNPGYPDEPRIMVSACHDRSPFLTVRCDCGYSMHFHETQLDALPKNAEIVTRCHRCQAEMVFPMGWFPAAFKQMRADGWIE